MPSRAPGQTDSDATQLSDVFAAAAMPPWVFTP